MPAEPKAAASKPNLDMARMAAALPELLEMSEHYSKQTKRTAANNPFRLPWFPSAAMPPEKERQMAMDSAMTEASQGWLAGGTFNALAGEGMLFPGYTYLSELAQRPEYRIISETIADDATRKWIKFTVVGEKERKEREDSKKPPVPDDPDKREDKIKASGKADKIKELNDFITQLQVRDRFYARCRDDGFFGRSHLYLDIKGSGPQDDPQSLKVSIGNGRSDASKALVNRTTPLRDLRVIEPVWTYPMAYNASNPLIPDWYNPQYWYVMGQELHVSRILPLVSRPVPDILKPAYAFGGLSLSQIAQPYVDIWLQTRASVAAMIHAFSVMVLQTDLQTTLQPGNAGGLIMRAMLFNALRDNQGLMITNKETEEFKNVSAPLGGLSDLQAQAQEHVASIARIPLVKYTGLQPKGLNASSEGEIRVYYDTITAYQHRSIRPDLTIINNFAQLSLFGEVDPDISFDFEPLWEMSQKEKSEKEKDDGERDMKYVDGGVLSPEEVRTRIANDPTLPYTDIDPNDVPDLAQEEEEGLVPGAASGGKKGGSEGGSEEGGERTANDNDPFGALDDAKWDENKHPRAPDGKFGSGGASTGGKGKTKKAAASSSSKGSTSAAPLSPKNLEKIGPKMGSNDGGVFKDKTSGKQFYIKKPQSPAHVTNELLGAKLYQMAGGSTLNYQPVEGGGHVATELVKLDKKNISEFTPAEKEAAQKDFAVQAWLGNWDAAGTGGDNKGIIGGKPTALDFGGALEYRAQGEPKGDAFGKQVNEITTMTDPLKSPDNAALYGGMTMAEQVASAKQVTELTNDQIITAVKEAGGTADLAQKLIDRKFNLANMYGLMTDTSKWDDVKHPRNPDGTFAKGTGGEEKPTPEETKAFADATGLKPTDFDHFDEWQMAVKKFKTENEQIQAEKTAAAAKEEEWKPSLALKTDDDDVPGPGAYGGLYITGGADPMSNHNLTVKKVLGNAPQIGIHYRRMLAKLIKDSPKYGSGHQIDDLKQKLIESLANSANKLFQKGDQAGGAKLIETAKKLGDSMGKPPAAAPEKPKPEKLAPVGPTPFEKDQAKKAQPLATIPGENGMEVSIFANADGKTFNVMMKDTESGETLPSAAVKVPTMIAAQKIAEEMIHGPGGKPVEKKSDVEKYSPKFAEALKNMAPQGDPLQLGKLKTKLAVQSGDATVEALKTALTPAEKKAIEAQYGSVESNFAKGQEYHAAKLKQEGQAKAAAELAQKASALKAEQQKQAALAATKKLEEEAKALAQQFKDNPTLKTHYEAIQSLTGGGKAAQQYMENARAKVKDAGLEGVIRGEEAASIIAYSGSHYAPLNAALREGVTTVGQYKFMKSLNHALDKLPAYTKTTTRKASLTPAQFALYKPGMVVEERGFTSSSKKKNVWSGTYHYTIHGKTGRDISMLSGSPGEEEVLFKSGTRFAVKKVSGNEIELEEID